MFLYTINIICSNMGVEGFEPPQSRSGTDHSDLPELYTQVLNHSNFTNEYLLVTYYTSISILKTFTILFLINNNNGRNRI